MKETLVLYVEDDEDVRELFALRLEGQLNCRVLECRTVNEAIHLLRKHPDIAAIVCDFNLPDANGDALYLEIRKNFPQLPFVLFTGENLNHLPAFKTFESDHPLNKFLSKPANIDDLVDIVDKQITKNSQVDESAMHPEYCKIQSVRFFNFNNCPCDVFLRLSTSKFVKIFNSGDLYDVDSIQKYRDKNATYFYISRKDFPTFNDFFAQTINAKLLEKNVSTEKTVGRQIQAVALAQDYIKALGIDESVINTVNNLVESSLAIVQEIENKEISQFIQASMQKNDYLFEHAMLISYIGGAISNAMGWDTKPILQKIILAAMIHDIDLESAQLAQIRDIEAIEDRALYNRLRQHPLKATEIIEKSKLGIPDIAQIVQNHHETPEGNGYPRQIVASTLPPLCCLFIMVEDFVDYTLKTQINLSIPHYLEILEQRFSSGNFKKVSVALKALIRKNQSK